MPTCRPLRTSAKFMIAANAHGRCPCALLFSCACVPVHARGKDGGGRLNGEPCTYSCAAARGYQPAAISAELVVKWQRWRLHPHPAQAAPGWAGAGAARSQAASLFVRSCGARPILDKPHPSVLADAGEARALAGAYNIDQT